MPSLSAHAHIALVGIGATALMDVWLLAAVAPGGAHHRVRDGGPLGRTLRAWPSSPTRRSRRPRRSRSNSAWAGLTHYLIGIAYAALLVALQGAAWLEQPTALPALVFGVLTVAAPWFVMQPAMGAGVLALKTPTPLKNGLRNLANHAVFGAGLYVAAAALADVAA